MSIEPAEDCGHLCCDTPNMPFHDHFLDAEDCDLCRSLREKERKLRERVKALADEVAVKEELSAASFPTQQQTLDWVRERWPDATDPKSRALKLGEEAGEVQGAVVKMSEGRASLDDLRMESAQLVICVMALAESAGFDLWDAVAHENMRAKGVDRG